MDKSIYKSCEQCLSLLTGIEIPRPQFPKEKDFGYTLKKEDAGILKSIAKQLSKGISMTDRQHALVKRKLLSYENQFKKHNIDIIKSVEVLDSPLRKIDRSHWIKILHYNDQPLLGIRFPFSKKIISRIDELRQLAPFQSRQSFPHYEKNTHYFPINAQNIFGLMQIADRFESEFSVHPEIQEIYEQLKIYDANKQDYVPGLYNYELKNVPAQAQTDLEDLLGKCDDSNLALYYDRRHLYGLKYFDSHAVQLSMANYGELAQKIMCRKEATVLVPSKVFPFEMLVEAIVRLQRFPILIVLDEKDNKEVDGLYSTHRAFKGFVANEDISVLFRMDGKSEFNQYVADNKLNNSVAKNTKIVYISNSKLPKTLFKTDWIASCVISIGGKGLRFNNVTSFVQQFDLQVVYEDESSSVYWNRSERKMINAIV